MTSVGREEGAEHCCPEFDPTPWDKQLHTWKEKKFISETIPQILHMPLPGSFRRAVEHLWAQAGAHGAAPEPKDALFLACDPNPWKSEIHLSVTREVEEAHMVRLTGTFYSEVFDGPYNGVPGYLRRMQASLADQGKRAKRYFFHFASCPRCARKYGHNYILAIAQLTE